MKSLDPDPCPRCESTDLEGLALNHPVMGDYDQTICEDCEHRWGDGYPDSQERPLPAGMVDCLRCEGRGDEWGRSCRTCRGDGIIKETP